LTAPEEEIQGVFLNSQLDVAAFYEPVVDRVFLGDVVQNCQFIKICQNTPQLCWGDEWPTLSPGGRGLG